MSSLAGVTRPDFLVGLPGYPIFSLGLVALRWGVGAFLSGTLSCQFVRYFLGGSGFLFLLSGCPLLCLRQSGRVCLPLPGLSRLGTYLPTGEGFLETFQ